MYKVIRINFIVKFYWFQLFETSLKLLLILTFKIPSILNFVLFIFIFSSNCLLIISYQFFDISQNIFILFLYIYVLLQFCNSFPVVISSITFKWVLMHEIRKRLYICQIKSMAIYFILPSTYRILLVYFLF